MLDGLAGSALATRAPGAVGPHATFGVSCVHTVSSKDNMVGAETGMSALLTADAVACGISDGTWPFLESDSAAASDCVDTTISEHRQSAVIFINASFQ